jgi:DNA-binding transcriptional LysR family regulator
LVTESSTLDRELGAPQLPAPVLALELRQWRCFALLAEELSFSGAAERLNISQPSLSQRIKALEERLGTRLFVRSPRGVRLTAAATALLPSVTQLLECANTVDRTAHELNSGPLRLRVGYSLSTCSARLRHLVLDYRSRYAHVETVSTTGSTLQNIELVRQGQLDVAFVRPPLPAVDGLGEYPLGSEPILLAVREDSRLAAAERVHRSQLADEQLVFLPPGSEPGCGAPPWASCTERTGRTALRHRPGSSPTPATCWWRSRRAVGSPPSPSP